MSFPCHRRVAPGLAVLLFAATASPLLAAPMAIATESSCQTEQRIEGPFRSVAKPSDLLPGPLTAHAVEPADPRTVYLADPTRVAVSHDAGCTWQLLLDLDVPVPAATTTSPTTGEPISLEGSAITALVVPDGPDPTGRLHILVHDRGLDSFAAVPRLFSRDGADDDFTQAVLPLTGEVVLAVSPTEPDIVYAGSDYAGQGAALARSDDAGRTFTLLPAARLDANDVAEFGVDALGVDPADSSRVLAAAGGLFESRDAGGNWQPLLDVGGLALTRGLAVHPTGDAAGTVSVVGTRFFNSRVHSGVNGGQLWQFGPDGAGTVLPRAGLDGVPQSFASGVGTDELVLTTVDLGGNVNDDYEGPGLLLLFDEPRQTWVDVADRRGHPFLDAQVDRTADPAVHLHTASTTTPGGADEYVVYSPPARGRIVPPTVDDGSGAPLDGAGTGFPDAPSACPDAGVFTAPRTRASSAQLTPERATLQPGAAGAAGHDLVLDLVGDAVALDLFVLLDTSTSMSSSAVGLACGLEDLVTGLAEDGVDVQVGLGEFWDRGPGQRYRRLVDLAPPGAEMQRALRTVRTRGGEEAHRTALLQSVTGQGLVVDGVETVAPGQAASFRDGALRVVLHITDEPWTATTPGEPSPFAVIDAMRAADVKHLGIQVVSFLTAADPGAAGDRPAGLTDDTVLRAQLDQFSAGTGALAPAGGVDCDGDGVLDLREGDPLVCRGVPRDGVVPLGGSVRALVDALAVRGPVRLQSRPAAGLTVDIARQYEDVDLRARGRFDFPLTTQCLPGAGAPVEVGIDAVAGAVRVATATVQVLCGPARAQPAAAGPAPEAPTVPVPATPDGPSVAVAGPAPVGPPPVVQVPAPAPAPAGAPAAAGAGAGAGAGAASSVTGLAGAPQETARRTQQAFVDGHPDRPLDNLPLAAVPLAGGAVATAALAAHLLATRRRPSTPAPALIRRRPEDHL